MQIKSTAKTPSHTTPLLAEMSRKPAISLCRPAALPFKPAVWLVTAACLLLSGCALTSPPEDSGPAVAAAGTGSGPISESVSGLESFSLQFTDYQVDPETFSLSFTEGEARIPISLPSEKRRVANLTENGEETAWEYPDEQVFVSVRPSEDYLQVTITSQAGEDTDNQFQWPEISGDVYYLPLGEGKRIPASDPAWSDFLNGETYSVLEQLSMPFFASASHDRAVVFIMENPYRTDLRFTSDPSIQFSVSHAYPAIDPQKESRFRIYLTENNPVHAAKTYQNYVKEQGRFVTLKQKAEENPNIEKLLGAPQIYLWGDNVIMPENIDWPAFRKALDHEVMAYLLEFCEETEAGAQAQSVITDIRNQDYVDAYQKNVICGYLSEILKRSDFYDAGVFPIQDDKVRALLQKDFSALDPSSRIQLNKYALAANLPEVFHPAGEWMNDDTVGLLQELKDAGIDRAWIGLNQWEQAFAKPELAVTAVSQGYLLGAYDSYHSIHEPGKEQWHTAKFADTSLYETASITSQSGEKISGFKNVGRKLNPTLSLPSVKQRMDEILSAGIPFDSWFIDCDATGEIFDDYTPGHITTQQQDLAARLERMAYIRDHHNMVIGSEGGHDFAASTIAFAHGIELKSFSWMDEDMKSNKDSEYYIGGYYNPTGGVPSHFSRPIPVKDRFRAVFLDPGYDLPLYKLVYNTSVITSYHWDWSTFKIPDSVNDRMLREILYNTAPLYHLDQAEWDKYREQIASHTPVWSQFSREASVREMTDFLRLTEDGSVQMTRYGEGMSVTANFGDAPYSQDGQEIPPHTLRLEMDGEVSLYSPRLSEERRQ